MAPTKRSGTRTTTQSRKTLATKHRKTIAKMSSTTSSRIKSAAKSRAGMKRKAAADSASSDSDSSFTPTRKRSTGARAPKASRGGAKKAVASTRKKTTKKDPDPIFYNNAQEIYDDLVKTLLDAGLKKAIAGGAIRLRVATVCSGIDAPIFGLNVVRESGQNLGFGFVIEYEHVYACEIEPWKQAFLQRNSKPPVIFRDVAELGKPGAKQATTAGGHFADIPEDYDMLVAGTVCVDFSNLNSSKPAETRIKKIFDDEYTAVVVKGDDASIREEGQDPRFLPLLQQAAEFSCGQSMRTFLSTLLIIARDRPRIVILENVATAPWSRIRNFFLPKLGYTAEHAKIDSKNFYLPQTRTRSYLIAVDNVLYGMKAAALIVDRWARAMEGFSKPNSASVERFLLPADDARLLRARIDLESNTDSTRSKDTDWDHSRDRHDNARREAALAKENSYTMAQIVCGRLVHVQPNERSWRQWLEGQTARVLDLLDINYQRCFKAGKDMRYKMMIGNLGQNVDFQTKWDELKLNNIPCITPSGMFWISKLHRLLTGIEALGLQGIPIDELVLSTETNGQLQDVAGNTMTVTVVATAILLALTFEHEEKPDGVMSILRGRSSYGNQNTKVVSKPVDFLEYTNNNSDPFAPKPSLTKVDQYSTWVDHVKPVSHAIELHSRGRRYCFCQNFTIPLQREKSLRVCVDCGDTACDACCGNPCHNHTDLLKDEHFKLLSSAELQYELRKCFPGRFQLSSGDLRSLVGTEYSESSIGICILKGLSDQVYYLDTFKITESITVQYKSKLMYARAVISEQNVTWYISFNPENWQQADLAGHDPNQPEIWVPTVSEFDVSVNSVDGDHERERGSLAVKWIEPKSSIPPEKTLSIRKQVEGLYCPSPSCGAAENSLFAKTASDTKVFLFKDVNALGDHDKDHFVFSSTKRQLDGDDYREVILRLDPEHKPHRTTFQETTLAGHIDGHWASVPNGISFSKLEAVVSEQLLVANLDEITGAGQSLCWDSNGAVFAEYRLPLLGLPVKEPTLNRWDGSMTRNNSSEVYYTIPATQLRDFLQQFAFALTSISLDGPREYLSKPQALDVEDGCDKCCFDAPKSSVISYDIWEKKSLKGKTRNQNPDEGPANLITKFQLTSKTEAKEIPQDAKDFETRLWNLPAAYIVQVRIDRVAGNANKQDIRLQSYHDPSFSITGSHDSLAHIRILLNPNTVVHRAVAHLQFLAHPRRDEAFTRLINGHWEVTANYQPLARINFTPFAECIGPSKDDTGVNRRPVRINTPRFWKQNHRLNAEQESAVAWMVAREDSPKPFKEREVAEEIISGVGVSYRIKGIASHDRDCRGGVVAHDVGFGKTVLVLGLLDHQQNQDKAFFKNHEGDKDRIALNATLIIVPDPIARQWKTEVQKFLGKVKLLLIQDYEDLTQLSLNHFRDAEIIIVSDKLFKLSKTKKSSYSLCQQRVFGLSRQPTAFSGRPYQDWYDRGIDNIKEVLQHADDLQRLQITSDRLIQEDAAKEETLKRALHIPTRKEQEDRLKVPDDVVAKATKSSEPTTFDKKLTTWCALDCFRYNRIIYDEFSFSEPAVENFMAHGRARSKWLLSGTPPLRALDDLCETAHMLSLHLARPEPNILPGLDKITKGPPKENMTDSELYRSYSTMKSLDFVYERHQQGMEFVKQMYRSDTLDRSAFRQIEVVLSTRLPFETSVAYMELYHSLAMAGFNILAIPDHIRDRLAAGVNSRANGADLSSAALAIRASGSLQDEIHVATGSDGSGLTPRQYIDQSIAVFEQNVRDIACRFKRYFDQLMLLIHLIEEGGVGKVPTEVDFIGPQGVSEGSVPNAKTSSLDEFVDEKRQDKWANCKENVMSAIHCLAMAKTRNQVSEFGGEDVWRRVIFCLTGQDPLGNPGITESRKWTAKEWYCLNMGFGTHTLWDLYDLTGKDTKLKEDITTVYGLTLAHEHAARKFPTFRGDKWNEFEGFPEKLATKTPINWTGLNDELEKVNDSPDLEAIKADAELTKPPVLSQEQKERRKNLKKLSKNQTDTAALRNVLNRLGAKFKKGDKPDDLIKKILAAESGYLGHEGYITNREKAPTREPFPQRAALTIRSKRIDGFQEAVNQSWHRVRGHQEALVRALQQWHSYKVIRELVDPAYKVVCGVCKDHIADRSKASLLRTCGHVICQQCGSHKQEELVKNCPVKECGIIYQVHATINVGLITAPDCDVAHTPETDPIRRGPKAQMLVNLIKTIQKSAPGDRIIVFTQYDRLQKQIIHALTATQISSWGGVNDSNIGNKIEAFKSQISEQDKARVLVLKLNSKESAGSNLIVANHVVFVSPLIMDDPYLWATYMRQAKGRCLRHGQKKTVFFYHLVSENTIDCETIRNKLSHLEMPESTFDQQLEAITQQLTADVQGRAAELYDEDDVQRLEKIEAAMEPPKELEKNDLPGDDNHELPWQDREELELENGELGQEPAAAQSGWAQDEDEEEGGENSDSDNGADEDSEDEEYPPPRQAKPKRKASIQVAGKVKVQKVSARSRTAPPRRAHKGRLMSEDEEDDDEDEDEDEDEDVEMEMK